MSAERNVVSMGAFVRAWETSKSIQEVKDKTGLEIASIEQRATKYRTGDAESGRLPIPLKNFPRGGGSRLDVNEAYELLAELRGVDIAVIIAEANANAVKTAERAAKRAEKAAETETQSA